MQRLKSILILLLALLAVSTQAFHLPHPGNPGHAPENRVWGFSATPDYPAGEWELQPVQPHRENRLAATIIASGRLSITKFDPLGLETVRAKFQRAHVMPLYHAWNVLSIGTLGKNDRLVERFESGEISRGQMTAGAVGNGVVAGATVAAGGGAASLAKAAVVKGAAAGFAATAVDHIGTEAVAGAAGYDSEQGGGALKVATGTATGAAVGFVAGKLSQSAAPKTETVQRAMSRGELDNINNSGALSRGGRAGPHHVSDAVNSTANRARQRLSLPNQPEVRATLEVPSGTFSPPSKVQPFKLPSGKTLPGGGMERTAPGAQDIPAKVIDVLEY